METNRPTKRSKPFYARWWFIVGIGLVLLIIFLPKPESTQGVRNSSDSSLTPTRSSTEKSPSLAFKQALSNAFPSDVITSSTFESHEATITLHEHNNYFGSGDGLNKALSTRVAGLFRDVEDLERLRLNIEMPDRIYHLGINRKQANEFYGGDLTDFRTEGNDKWREEFLPKWDTPAQRQRFFDTFVVSDRR